MKNKFISQWSFFFERAGLKELQSRATFMDVSYEYARQIFNEVKIPSDDKIVFVSKKMSLTDDETNLLLILANEARSEGETKKHWSEIATRVSSSGLLPGEVQFDPNKVSHGRLAKNMVPVYASISAGHGDCSVSYGDIVGETDMTDSEVHRGCFAIACSGDSMEPVLLDGDYLIFQPFHGTPNSKSIYAIQVAGWETSVVKKVRIDPRGRYILVSLNKEFPPIELDPAVEDIRVLGVLIRQSRIHQVNGNGNGNGYVRNPVSKYG